MLFKNLCILFKNRPPLGCTALSVILLIALNVMKNHQERERHVQCKLIIEPSIPHQVQ
jgi:hypothetical protein